MHTKEALINSSTRSKADQIAMIASRTTKVVAGTTMPRRSAKRARDLVATHGDGAWRANCRVAPLVKENNP